MNDQSQKFFQKAREVKNSIPNGSSDSERKSLLMKAASFYQMAIKASPGEPLPVVLGELALTLLQAGDKDAMRYADESLKSDTNNFEARLVKYIAALDTLAGHEGPSETMGGFGIAGALFNLGVSHYTGMAKGASFEKCVKDLALAFQNNLTLKSYEERGGAYLWDAGMMLSMVEAANYWKATRPLLDAILKASWENVKFDDEQRKNLDDLLMQAEGTILLLKN